MIREIFEVISQVYIALTSSLVPFVVATLGQVPHVATTSCSIQPVVTTSGSVLPIQITTPTKIHKKNKICRKASGEP